MGDSELLIYCIECWRICFIPIHKEILKETAIYVSFLLLYDLADYHSAFTEMTYQSWHMINNTETCFIICNIQMQNTAAEK